MTLAFYLIRKSIFLWSIFATSIDLISFIVKKKELRKKINPQKNINIKEYFIIIQPKYYNLLRSNYIIIKIKKQINRDIKCKYELLSLRLVFNKKNQNKKKATKVA
jgi:hypothetical protein